MKKNNKKYISISVLIVLCVFIFVSFFYVCSKPYRIERLKLVYGSYISSILDKI